MTAYLSEKNTVLAQSPLSFYRLDESSGTNIADSSGNGKTATASSTGITYNVASSLRGDTDTAITVASSGPGFITIPTSVNPTGSCSIEFRVKIAAAPSVHVSLVANYSSNAGFTQVYGLGVGLNTNRTVTFEYANTSNSTTVVTSTTALSTGVWHYILATWNGTTMSLIVDNNAANTTNPSVVQTNSVNKPFIIGGSYYADDYADASFDEVAIYGTNISSQATNDYNAGLAITKTAGTRTLVRTQVTRTGAMRFRIRSQATRTGVTRFVVRTLTTRTSGARLLVRTLATRTGATRIRARTQKTVSTGLRFQVFKPLLSAPLRVVTRTFHALSSGLRLPIRTQTSRVSGIRTTLRSAAFRTGVLRFLVRTLLSRTSGIRVRLRSQVSRSTGIRLPLRGLTQIGSLRMRLRTLVGKTSGVRVRARTTAQPLWTGLRVPLRTLVGKTSGLRTRIRTTQPRTLATRVRASTRNSLSLSVRARIMTRKSGQTVLRSVIRSSHPVTLGMRFTLLARQTLVCGYRVRVGTKQRGLVALRSSVFSRRGKVASLRISIFTPGSPLPGKTPFQGGVILPVLNASPLAYAVAGTVLDVQPTLCTAPVSTAPLPAGSMFTLGWTNPSPMITALFTSGAVLSLQFALTDGSLRTAQVQIQATTSGNQLLVTCTLLQPSSAYIWTFPVQAS